MKSLIKEILIACIIAFLIMQFVKPTIVKQSSMEPTLSENNYIFLSKQAYNLFGDPKRGDIVVLHTELKTEKDEEKLLIKRIVGLPGETIDITDGMVYINGKLLEEPYIMEPYTMGEIDNLTVPEGNLFVMGDNRGVSLDSRDERVGCTPIEGIVGKAFFRLYPFNRIGTL